jgi:hypothetical protein
MGFLGAMLVPQFKSSLSVHPVLISLRSQDVSLSTSSEFVPLLPSIEVTRDFSSPASASGLVDEQGQVQVQDSPEIIWQEIQDQIRTWHFQPDIQAVQIILALLASYKISESDHLWLHLIGPSGSGKTALGISMVDKLYSDHHKLEEISVNTFLSGLTRGKQKGKMNSFLHQIGERGLIYAPDFTTFLSNDDHSIGRIAGQLRGIYDGSLSRRAGSMEQANEWLGNIAMITAFTPSVENKWHKHNREGERFLTLRWPKAEPRGESEEREMGRIMKSVEDKKEKQNELRGLVRRFIEWGSTGSVDNVEVPPRDEKGGDTKPPIPVHTLSSPGTNGIEDCSYKLAKLVGKLRTLPVRSDGKNISHVAGEEGPGRCFKQLVKVARGWAGLLRRGEVLPEDWGLAERLAIDTIPETRRWVLEALPWQGGVTRAELVAEMTPFQNAEAAEWHLADLQALGVVGINGAKEIWLMDRFVELAGEGCPGWVERLGDGIEERFADGLERLERKEFSVVK